MCGGVMWAWFWFRMREVRYRDPIVVLSVGEREGNHYNKMGDFWHIMRMDSRLSWAIAEVVQKRKSFHNRLLE